MTIHDLTFSYHFGKSDKNQRVSRPCSTQYENIGVKTDTMTSLAPVMTSSMTMDMGFLGI